MAREYGGLGLGLAIVRHIVEMHGGRASVSSQGKGKGATFRVWLPAASERHDQMEWTGQPESGARRTPHAAPSRLAGKRALVVDDDPDALELISRMLETQGMVVNAASCAEEGLAAFEREVPDVILSDLAMPEEDGYDLIRSVRKRPADSGGLVPAIAVTALARPEDSARSLASGFQIHLTKPLDPGELFSAVERLAAGDLGHGPE
jgi:CheY-like chemotaxis protein